MRSFVQARYVHWHIVGKCPIQKIYIYFFKKKKKKKTFCSPVVCEGSIFLSYSVSGQWLDFYLEGLAFRLFLVENLIVF